MDEPKVRVIPPSRRRPLWRAVRLGLAPYLLLLLAYGVWGAYEQHRLNARLREYRAAGDVVYPEDFASAPVPPGENAADDLLAFGRMIEPVDKVWLDFDLTYFDLPWRADEVKVVEAAVRQYADGIRLIEAALRKPGVNWEVDYGAAMGWGWQTEPRSGGPRGASILLLGDALLAHQVAADDSRALRRIGQQLRLAEIVDRVQLMSAHVTAMGTAGLASRIVEEIVPDLKVGGGGVSVGEVRLTIDALLDEEAIRRGMIRALMGERRAGVRQRMQSPPGGDFLERWSCTFGTWPFRSHAAELMARADTVVLRAFQRSGDWPAYCRVVDLRPLVEEGTGWRAAMAFGPRADNMEKVVLWHYHVSADRRLAAVALAIRCYAAEHEGRLPIALQELVPVYLPAVPVDPFAADGSVLRYRRDGEHPAVYSVGGDGRDDGGSDRPRPEVKDPDPRVDRWHGVDAVFHLTRQPRMVQRPEYGIRGRSLVPSVTKAAEDEPGGAEKPLR